MLSNILSLSAITLLVKLGTAALSFLLLYVLAENLTSEDFGLFSFVTTLVLFGASLVKFGLEQTAVKYFARGHAGSLFQSPVLRLFFTQALVVVPLLFIALTFIPSTISAYGLVITVCIFSQALLGVCSGALRGLKLPHISMVYSGFSTQLVMLLLVWLFFGSSLEDAFYFLVLATVGSVLNAIWLTHQNIKKCEVPDLPCLEYSKLKSLNVRFFATSLAALSLQQLSVLILPMYVSYDTVGAFNLALRLSLLIGFPLLAINYVVMPHFAKLEGDKKALRVLYKKVQQVTLLISIVALICIFLCSRFVFGLFDTVGEEAIYYFYVLAIGQIVNLAMGTINSLLAMAGFERFNTKLVISFALVSAAAMLFFAPIYGAMAMAVIASLSMVLQNAFSYRYLYQKVLSH